MAAVTPEALLWSWLREGYKYRVKQGWSGPRRHGRQAYLDQVNFEMQMIVEKEFTSYFLLVSETVRWAKDAGIAVGPGRGSSAASLVCFLLRITEPDPLDFPLCDFSRFVDPTREDLPDIDIDFQDNRRHEVREHLVHKYGADHIGNVGTFVRFKGRNSIDDVARVHGLPKRKMEELKGMIIERSAGDARSFSTIQDTFEMFEHAKAIVEEFPQVRMAADLEGNYRSMSTHAAGVVVTTAPVSDITAMYTRLVKGQEITAVACDKYDAEYLGLMKVDLLGLSTMGMISLAVGFAGMTLEELYRIPLDDPETLAAFKANDVIGVFQFEGRAARLVGMDVKPDSFLELVDINALSRPGPMISGTTNAYIAVKQGKVAVTSIHPIIDKITEGTKGQLIYQEQILHVLAQFGGFSVKRVHELRRIISKSLGEAQFNAFAEDFADNAARLHGVSRELSMEVWSLVVSSALYSFVYSHSLAYSQIGWWCMYLKVHHPTAFYAAQLQKISDDKWGRLIKDAAKHGVNVRGVTPGQSSLAWSPAGGGGSEVVAGWLQLKGVGEKTAEKIQALSDAGKISSADDLLAVPGIGPKTLDKFRDQMESDDPFSLLRAGRIVGACYDAIRRGEVPLRPPTHHSEEVLEDAGGDGWIIFMGLVKLIEYKDLIEEKRSKTGQDVEEIKRGMRRPDLVNFAVLSAYDEHDEDVFLRINQYLFPKVKSQLEQISLESDVVWVRAKKFADGFGARLQVEELHVISPPE